LVVLHVETDVVEDAPCGRSLDLVGLGEPELATGKVDDRRVVAGTGPAAEGLRVPRAIGDGPVLKPPLADCAIGPAADA
jgi:hypothetical protein